MTAKKNAFYAHSGGMTGVINSSACGVIETCFKHKNKIGNILVGRHGMQGLLQEELFDMSAESKKAIAELRNMPGGAFGSCRYKLTSIDQDLSEYVRIIEVLKAHNIGYFFYNGGNDSADTAYKISLLSKKLGHELYCIGIPKTVDNDLPGMDFSPGFPSVAKFVATTVKETGIDVAAMSPANQIFILEVPGRDAGWIAAASILAKEKESDPPHIILCPEVLFDEKKFLARVEFCVKKYGYCAIVASESLRDLKGLHVASTGQTDAFGHMQFGGIAPILANLIKKNFGYKNHYAIGDYILRASRHLGCPLDLKFAYELGKSAVEMALAGKNGVAPVVVRKKGKTPSWEIKEISLKKIANSERNMPKNFLAKDGLGVTQKCIDYLKPLIVGEDFPPFKNGLPRYPKLKKVLVPKKLPEFTLEKRQ